jgi:hypothetical protein
VDGAFFYAGSPTELAGRTITRVQCRMGARLSVGASNTGVNVNFYTHTSANKPGGDVTRTTGPTTILFPAGWNPGPGDGWFDLPTTFGAALLAGGGLAIAGDPYAGFAGRLQDPAAGQIKLDWSR